MTKGSVIVKVLLLCVQIETIFSLLVTLGNKDGSVSTHLQPSMPMCQSDPNTHTQALCAHLALRGTESCSLKNPVLVHLKRVC